MITKEGIIKKSKTYNYVAGLDEVGAGVLCGDLVVAAVVLGKNHGIEGLTDSKKLSEKKRALLYQEIKEKALDYSIVKISPCEIDQINIYQARMLGFVRAVSLLKNVDYAIIDGNKVPENYPVEADFLIKGDMHIECVSAASILAKHERDTDVINLSKKHPYNLFALERHKGYGTKVHNEMIAKHGVIKGFYRESYKPVKLAIEKGMIIDLE